MQNSKRAGRSIDYTPAEDVTGGDLVVFPGMVAVASTDIAGGALGACETEGVFELRKDGGAIVQGAAVFATSESIITTEPDGNIPAGRSWAAADAGDDTVLVKINA